MISIEDVLESGNLSLAMENLISKRNSCGIDNIFVSEFEDYWESNKKILLREFRSGRYEPEIILQKEIVGYNGKRRIISQMTCTDRYFLRALNQVIQPICESQFYDFSHAYREGYGTATAVRMAADYIAQGKIWVAEIDIMNFFDSIPLTKLNACMEACLELDDILCILIKKYLRCRIEYDGKIETKQTGVVQGSPISPMLSNLYLTQLDSMMDQKGYSAVRFSDNINIYAATDNDAFDALQSVSTYLNELGLSVHKEKSGVFHALNRRFLGHSFELDKSGNVIAKRYRQEQVYYNNWHTSSLQRTDRNYHLINDGILTKRDCSLLFENENGKKYLPVEVTDSVNVYSSVIFTSGLFEFLSKKRLRLSVFDKYGNHIGSFMSSDYVSGGKTMIRQAELYLNPEKRLLLAKKIEIASMHNIRANLRYYKKQKGTFLLDEAIKSLSSIITELNEASSIEELMMIEARGCQIYYQMFNEIITNRFFLFTKRTKRPPKDPLNAMISFGNVYLYNRMATEIGKTSLDVRIGILHSTNTRSESLNLDLAELFKPILVDRTIFTLINKRMIHSKEHFEDSKDGGIYLNKAGKSLFLRELEKKIYQTVQVGNLQRTYEYLMREEVQKILRAVLRDENYKPYKYTT